MDKVLLTRRKGYTAQGIRKFRKPFHPRIPFIYGFIIRYTSRARFIQSNQANHTDKNNE